MRFLISFYDENIFARFLHEELKHLWYCLRTASHRSDGEEAVACKYYFYAPAKPLRRKDLNCNDFDLFFARFQYPRYPRLISFEFVRFFPLSSINKREKDNQKIIFSTIPDTHRASTLWSMSSRGDVIFSILCQPPSGSLVQEQHGTDDGGWSTRQNANESLLNEYVLMKCLKNIHLSTIMSLCCLSVPYFFPAAKSSRLTSAIVFFQSFPMSLNWLVHTWGKKHIIHIRRSCEAFSNAGKKEKRSVGWGEEDWGME